MRATSVVAPPWTDGSCWDQAAEGSGAMGGLEVTGEEDGKNGDLAHILLLQDLPRAWEMLLLSKEGKGARWPLPHSKKGNFSQILQQHLSRKQQI